MGKTTQDLRDEHAAIENVLLIMENRIAKNENDDDLFKFGAEVIEFLVIFTDKCHHGKEEGYLFRAMEAKGVPNQGGPIGTLLHEHEEARGYIAEMRKAVEAKEREAFVAAAAAYIKMLRAHVLKENRILFPLADRVLSEAEQDQMFENFEKHEEVVIGHGVHERLHAEIDRWQEEINQ